jgi:hypothetical protein
MLPRPRHADRRTPGMTYHNPPEASSLVDPEKRVPICYIRNIRVDTIWSRFEPAWPTSPSPEAPSERNPSKLPVERDRDEEEEWTLKFRLKLATPRKSREKRKTDYRKPSRNLISQSYQRHPVMASLLCLSSCRQNHHHGKRFRGSS